MAGDEPEKGDKVSYAWGGGQPGGTVVEKKKEGEVAITSKRGNKIKKNAEPSDPAIHIERSGNDVVKKASEVQVDKKGSGSAGASDDKKDEDGKAEKRKHDGDEKTDDSHVKNADGKEVKAGGKATNKKQKQEKEKVDKTKGKKEEEKKEEEKKTEEKQDAPAEKKRPGRPKGTGESKAKKEVTPRQEGDLVSSRTRSRGK